MFRLAFWKKIPRAEFAARAIALAATHVSRPTGDLANIKDTIRKIKLLPGEFPDRECARIYLRLEKHLAEEETKNRVSKEALRAQVFSKCSPKDAEGSFALLFFPSQMRHLRLFEYLFNETLRNSVTTLEPKSVPKLFEGLQSLKPFGDFVKKEQFDSDAYERTLSGLSPDEAEAKATREFTGAMGKILEVLTLHVSPIRAELALQRAYQQIQMSLDFIEDLAFVLHIMPEHLFGEERIAMLPKPELEKTLKSSSKQLGETLHELGAQRQKLDEVLERLKAADRAKGDFIAVVSHHFRTPLSIIRWNVETLLEELVSKKKITTENRLALSAVQSKTMFLINTLDAIFDVLSIEGKSITLDRRPGQLWEVIEETLREIKKDLDHPEREIRFDKSSAPIKETSFDAAKVGRILKILIRNADQLSAVDAPITVSLKEAIYNQKPAFACAIVDQGIGISKADLDKIFTKFFRGEQAVKTVSDGVGLGLYIAKNFAEAHGGTIEVKSEQSKGSEFRLLLPI